MNRSHILRGFAAFLFLLMLGVFIYTAYFVPDHRSPDGLTDYSMNHTIFYAPMLFLASGFVIGFFLKRDELWRYVLAFWGIVLAVMLLFRCVLYPVSIAELPAVLFAHVVCVGIITVMHSVTVLLAQLILWIVFRFMKGKMS